MRFEPLHVSQSPRYALERDTQTGLPIFSIPVDNRLVGYTEWYRISEEELAHFLVNHDVACAFAFRCARHEEDERLVMKPGRLRGAYDDMDLVPPA